MNLTENYTAVLKLVIQLFEFYTEISTKQRYMISFKMTTGQLKRGAYPLLRAMPKKGVDVANICPRHF